MVKIITDTTACLSSEFVIKYNIPVIPQIINFGTESFLEGVTIDNATFIRKLKSSTELPKTAAPPPEWFVKEFTRLVPEGEPILCIHPSAEVSGTVRSATVAAMDFPESDIRVIDTRLVSHPLGILVKLAAEWSRTGLDADTIEARLRSMAPCFRIYVVVATLDYLAKGGRIGGATALLGSILQVKPILAFRDGRIEQFERERTQKRAIARMKELVLTQITRQGEGYLGVLHADALEEASTLAADLGFQLGLEHVDIIDVPPAITTHAGPGLLGVSFLVNNPAFG